MTDEDSDKLSDQSCEIEIDEDGSAENLECDNSDAPAKYFFSESSASFDEATIDLEAEKLNAGGVKKKSYNGRLFTESRPIDENFDIPHLPYFEVSSKEKDFKIMSNSNLVESCSSINHTSNNLLLKSSELSNSANGPIFPTKHVDAMQPKSFFSRENKSSDMASRKEVVESKENKLKLNQAGIHDLCCNNNSCTSSDKSNTNKMVPDASEHVLDSNNQCDCSTNKYGGMLNGHSNECRESSNLHFIRPVSGAVPLKSNDDMLRNNIVISLESNQSGSTSSNEDNQYRQIHNPSPMYNWQATLTTVKERFAFLFNNEILSDVHFVVGRGEEEQNIPAHKFVLAVGSSVFDAMFNGRLACQQQVINLPDVEPQAFLALLSFLYRLVVKLFMFYFQYGKLHMCFLLCSNMLKVHNCFVLVTRFRSAPRR